MRAKLQDDQFHRIARALADPRRYELLRRIGKSEKCVPCGDLLGCSEISAATLSHHMKELETAGLIESSRAGKFVNYKLRRDVLDAYLAKLATVQEAWQWAG